MCKVKFQNIRFSRTCHIYSLYSTAMQNTWRRGLALGNASDARIWRWIFWRYLTLKFASPPTPTPDVSQWNIGCVGSQRKMLALAMYISGFLCRFQLRLVPNANPISSGIWALELSLPGAWEGIFRGGGVYIYIYCTGHG